MRSLGEFIVMRQAEYPQAKGELSGILAAIRLAAKVLHRDINRARENQGGLYGAR